MLDFRMETFLTVCHCMNFTRASEELQLTQPAVSQQIRFLEKHYKTKLFRYEGKRLYLTEAGEILRSASVAMKENEQSLQEQITLAGSRERNIHFGITGEVGEEAAVEVVKHYLTRYPEARIHVEIGNTEELYEALGTGNMDVVLVEGRPRKKEYEYSLYPSKNYIAVAAPQYRFSQSKDKGWMPEKIEDLREERVFLREKGSEIRNIFEKYINNTNDEGDKFEKTAEIESEQVIKELTKSGCGITFLYEAAVSEELHKGELKMIPLQNLNVERNFSFVWKRDSIYAKEYRELLRTFPV